MNEEHVPEYSVVRKKREERGDGYEKGRGRRKAKKKK